MKNILLLVFLVHAWAVMGIALDDAGYSSSSSFVEAVKSELEDLNTQDSFGRLRTRLKHYGIDNFKNEMILAGHFTKDGFIDSDEKPFNPFARILAGKLQPKYSLDLLTEHGLQEYAEKYLIAKNTPDNDANWQNPEWAGRSSMSLNHQFLLIKDTKWSTFNVLTLGLDPPVNGLEQAITLLNEMEVVALTYAKAAFHSDNIGLYFHVYPTNSVQTLHLHIVDLNQAGLSLAKLAYKNLPLGEVRAQLVQELNSQANL